MKFILRSVLKKQNHFKKNPKHTRDQKIRFLIGRNRTNRANFRGVPLFQATCNRKTKHVFFCFFIYSSSHLFLNREGRWGTTDDFATSFLHFSLFSTAFWDLANSRPVHFLMLSSHLFLCFFTHPLTQYSRNPLTRADISLSSSASSLTH